VRIIWSEIAQATFARFMADQAGMMAVNGAVEALADDPAPLGTILVQIRCGLIERGRDLIVALRLRVKWENGANR
jgi:hypothetical protein